MTWRRLGVLIDWLPGECATKTAIRDSLTDEEIAQFADSAPDGHGAWSSETLRLAALEDAVNRLTAVTIFLAGDRKGQPKMPDPVRRPGLTGKAVKRKPVLTDEGRAYLKYLRENHGALPPGYQMVQAR